MIPSAKSTLFLKWTIAYPKIAPIGKTKGRKYLPEGSTPNEVKINPNKVSIPTTLIKIKVSIFFFSCFLENNK